MAKGKTNIKQSKQDNQEKTIDYNELFSDESLYRQARENKSEVTIVMDNGEVIKGYILSVKAFTITVSDGNVIRLIYKHAIRELQFKP